MLQIHGNSFAGACMFFYANHEHNTSIDKHIKPNDKHIKPKDYHL
jgi:hypothetical protein